VPHQYLAAANTSAPYLSTVAVAPPSTDITHNFAMIMLVALGMVAFTHVSLVHWAWLPLHTWQLRALSMVTFTHVILMSAAWLGQFCSLPAHQPHAVLDVCV
jgi:hypothetical protein